MKRRYEHVKQIDPKRFDLPRFTLTVYRMHMAGMTPTKIAEALGIDRNEVVRAISSVWEMDNPQATVCKDEITVGQVMRDVFQ